MKKLLRNAGAILSVGGVGVYTIYKMVYGREKKNTDAQGQILQGKQYEPYESIVRSGMDKAGRLPFQRIFIEAKDGITLAGKYYHFKDGAPLILFFHGYRGSSLRDGNGILLYAQKCGYNILLADQRGHGKSGGKNITFGIWERHDCMSWVRYINRRFGDQTPIVLAGISMGASTVLMAADLGLPVNVKGIIADCPYSAPKEILMSVIKHLKYPVRVTYTAVKLGAKIFGGFDVEEHTALESMQNCYLPVLFIHGDEDYLVPCEMSRLCFDVCSSADKKHVVVKGAAHGMSYCVDGELYEREIGTFLERIFA